MIYKKVCAIDNKEFEASRADAKYCSDACKKKAQRKKTDYSKPFPTHPENGLVTNIDLASGKDKSEVIATFNGEPMDLTEEEKQQILAQEDIVPSKKKKKTEPIPDNIPPSLKDKMAEIRQRQNARLRAKGLPLVMEGPEVFHFVRTGIKELDAVTSAVDTEGIGGLPRKRITEIFGPKGAGKSSLVKTIMSHNVGLRVLFFDAEGGLVGAPEDLNIVKGNVVEEIMPNLLDALESKDYDLIILDSIASLVTQKQFDDEKEGIAPMARVFGPYVKKLVAHINPLIGGLPDPDPGTAVVFINQFRSTTQSFGVMEYTVGGKSMEYYASLRLEFRSASKDHIIRNGKLAGQMVRVKVEKTRFGTKNEEFKFPLMFEQLRISNEDYVKRLKELGLA